MISRNILNYTSQTPLQLDAAMWPSSSQWRGCLYHSQMQDWKEGARPPVLSLDIFSYSSGSKDEAWTAKDFALQMAEQQNRRSLGPLVTSWSRDTANPELTISRLRPEGARTFHLVQVIVNLHLNPYPNTCLQIFLYKRVWMTACFSITWMFSIKMYSIQRKSYWIDLITNCWLFVLLSNFSSY